MNPILLLAVILFPIVSAILMSVLHLKEKRVIHIYTMTVTLLTTAAAWLMIRKAGYETVELLQFTEHLTLQLKFDGLGRFFCGLIATLWPVTVLYGFEYMDHDAHQASFFTFFLIAFGISLGVSMSGNLFTLYCFYEMLTLSTVPLVLHTRTVGAVRATRTYFTISLGGAAFAFLSMIYLIVMDGQIANNSLTHLFYLFGFFGFGVKAAVFPLHVWLPKASVAPTPVTALLHAVAVVKSGVFAIIRLTYYCYGVEVLRGTAAQYVAIGFAIFTIFYGATKAVKESHWKRRLAYSTVANLSYILFGVLLMNSAGLGAGLLHMVFHAEIKILGFFCAGAVLHMTGREYLYELDGIGYKMPVTMGCFMVAALALTGIPPFSGFVSKFALLTAAAETAEPCAYIGAIVILIGALLTAMYMFTVVRRAFFPDKDADLTSLEKEKEAGWRMLVPMCFMACGILVTGLCAGSIQNIAMELAKNIVMW